MHASRTCGIRPEAWRTGEERVGNLP